MFSLIFDGQANFDAVRENFKSFEDLLEELNFDGQNIILKNIYGNLIYVSSDVILTIHRERKLHQNKKMIYLLDV